jgi:hypothetical protein
MKVPLFLFPCGGLIARAVSLACFAFTIAAKANTVALSTSVFNLAANGSANYTFLDSATGESVVINVALSPYSTNASEIFTLLDGGTRIGIGSDGDGNHVDNTEGLNFTAALVSTSSGVNSSSVQFQIAGLGLRDTDNSLAVFWSSTATVSNGFRIVDETLNALDTGFVALDQAGYSGQLRAANEHGSDGEFGFYQISDYGPLSGQSLVMNVSFTTTPLEDPRISSWLTNSTTRYARIYKTKADQANGISSTTWTNGAGIQSLPVYAGIQAIYSSTNWVYFRASGLGSHVMGPWYLDAQKTQLFPNYPKNQKTFYRIPKNPTVPATKTLTSLGAIGYFVDGVAMFDGEDSYKWNGTTETNQGTGYWYRDAFTNEFPSFDPNYAHQEQTGTHHYHVTPPALRYLLGDNILFNTGTKTYSENLTNQNLQHSPILGWVRDGFPLYGPYGYSNPTNASSGIRRMTSGFTLRNGSNGTTDLRTTGRTALPAWATRAYSVSANQSGPAVNTTYFLGRYWEDYDYMGDLGKIQGIDFDLDEYNGRYCVTPEFPNGMYAYFLTIEANGLPKFPYITGRSFYGNPTGAVVTALSETVTTNFVAGTNITVELNTPMVNASTVTLVWNGIEGGTYKVESSSTLTNWTDRGSSIATGTTMQTNIARLSSNEFYRVAQTAVAPFESVASNGYGISSVSPSSGVRGSTLTLTINLDSSANPPPQNAPIISVTVGSISGTNLVHVSQTQVTCSLSIPANATTGAQTVFVVFPGPPSNPSATQTYTLIDGFTIQ